MMLCKKCTRQIADDSAYCSYCGVPVERQSDAEEDDCVRPHMPKKNCTSCGKELPGSTIAPLCAMCTIRQRNRELEERRKNDDKSYAARDRYDMSGEFDQTVFEQNSSNYYRGDRFAQARSARDTSYAHPTTGVDLDEEKKPKRMIVAVAIIMIIMVVAPFFLSLASCGVNTFGTIFSTPSSVTVKAIPEPTYTPAMSTEQAAELLSTMDGDWLNTFFESMTEEQANALMNEMSEEQLAAVIENIDLQWGLSTE